MRARAENAPMRVTRATIAIVLALLLPAAVGCGSSSGGSSSSTAAAADNGESAKAPDQILSDVNDAVRGAKSVHMSGAVNSDSSDIGFDVMLSSDAAKGTLTLSGNEIKLVRVGDAAYFSGSPEFYKTLGGGDAAANLLQGRWIKIPSTDSRFASFEQFTDKGKLFSSMLQAEGTVTKSGVRTYNGQKVVVLRDSGGRRRPVHRRVGQALSGRDRLDGRQAGHDHLHRVGRARRRQRAGRRDRPLAALARPPDPAADGVP